MLVISLIVQLSIFSYSAAALVSATMNLNITVTLLKDWGLGTIILL